MLLSYCHIKTVGKNCSVRGRTMLRQESSNLENNRRENFSKQNSDDFEKKLINKLISEKRFAQAEEIAIDLVEKKTTAESVKVLADIYFAQNGNADAQAIQCYETALSAGHLPESVRFEIYKNLGNISVRAGQYDKALSYYDKAQEIDEDASIIHVNLGVLAIQQADWNKAVENFRYALMLDTNTAMAWMGLALVYRQVADSDLCYANLFKTLDIESHNEQAIKILMEWATQDEEHRFFESIALYYEGLDFNPEMSWTFIRLCWALKKEAILRIELFKLLEFCPDHEKAKQLLETYANKE